MIRVWWQTYYYQYEAEPTERESWEVSRKVYPEEDGALWCSEGEITTKELFDYIKEANKISIYDGNREYKFVRAGIF